MWILALDCDAWVEIDLNAGFIFIMKISKCWGGKVIFFFFM